MALRPEHRQSRPAFAPAFQRGLLITLFLVTQVGVRLPYVRVGFTDWLRHPSNPVWLYAVLWYSLVTFIAVPVSILLGGATATGWSGVDSAVE